MHRAGECAFHVTKKFALDQCGDQRTAVHGNERLVPQRTGVVNGTRDHFFAGAALSENQDRMNTVSGLSNDPVELVHFWCAADDAAEPLSGPDLLAQHAVFGFELEMGRHTR